MADLGKSLSHILSPDRVKTRLIDLVSYASDAGFYYLRPKAVVQPVTEDEIQKLFLFSKEHQVPITFRAGGTSLSGQSISDGILADLSIYWRMIKIEDGGMTVRVQPGVTGGIVNGELRKYSRKIGPDPASIHSAMMGGIISNNASGMCCGVKDNSYHTVKYIRFILPNGRRYSTGTPADYDRFKSECPDVWIGLIKLRDDLRGNPESLSAIRSKYLTKNTVGYSVNAFIDYEDPLQILAHLLIGAEGTLGFISEAVLHTITDHPAKSAAMIYFPDIYAACAAILPLRDSGAEAVELMDRASLRSVEHIKGVPSMLQTLPEEAAALLVEYQGPGFGEIRDKIAAFFEQLPFLNTLATPRFTEDADEQVFLWKLRKGMFPSVGSVRAAGTTVILEDIAVPVERLGEAILHLQQLFKKYGYNNAIIFGHAKDGNIHFVVTQSFDSASEIERYDLFLREVVALIAGKYNGALKAEHGTGRNMAPFVETEWGAEIYRVMKELKNLIDPGNLLNPGVIINADKQAHIRNLKDLPLIEPEADKCIECGFCEYKCPSRDITLTPRRRIVVRREMLKLERAGKSRLYNELRNQYEYDGLETCAVDGLCATACPVDINTGTLVKRLRREDHSFFANRIALFTVRHFRFVTAAVRFMLQTGELLNKVFGRNAMVLITRMLKKIIPAVPLWSNQIKPAGGIRKEPDNCNEEMPAVVFFPSCISRVMGGSASGGKNAIETFATVSRKAGIKALIFKEVESSCCGQIYSSKGFNPAFSSMANDTVDKLWGWTKEGKWPVVLDVTSCTYTLRECRPVLTDENREKFDRLIILDSIEFIADHIMPVVKIRSTKKSIVLHPVCSTHKMGIEGKFLNIAKKLADEVSVPLHAGCCGMAGDRGFLFPELTASATAPEAREVKKHVYDGYYSSGKTCEMAMSDAVGKNYESVLYLLDECI